MTVHIAWCAWHNCRQEFRWTTRGGTGSETPRLYCSKQCRKKTQRSTARRWQRGRWSQ